MKELKRDYVDMLANASYIGLLLIPFFVDHPDVWLYTLWAIAGVAILAWSSSIFRYVAISSQPVSKISSSAQGYVELIGKVKFAQNDRLQSPSGESCVWYRRTRYELKNRNISTSSNFFDLIKDDLNLFALLGLGIANNHWYEKEVEESELTFTIEDGTGECTVKPKYADFFTKTVRTYFQGTDIKYEEALLLHGEKVYVLGEFKSFGASRSTIDADKEASILLAEWKVDKEAFHHRFDENKNGRIDIDEWEKARRTALKTVKERHASDTTWHEIAAPHDDRLFLISTFSPHELKGRFLSWSYLHLFVLFLALIFAFGLNRENAIDHSNSNSDSSTNFSTNESSPDAFGGSEDYQYLNNDNSEL